MDMIDKQLAKDLAEFNAKPFDVEEIYKLGEDNRLKKEYKIMVLKLNEYLLLNNISVEGKKIEENLYDWVNSESKRDLSELELSMIKAELLFFLGTFAFHEFLFIDESKNGITKIRRYESNLQKEEKQIEEILRILNELEINKGSLILHDESDEFFKLNTDYYKLILASSGRSIITYIIARETVKRIKKICSISKMKILSKITEIFVMFKFIESEEEAYFLSNFYRQLNRVNKDKEEQIKQIIARKISIFYPDRNK